MRPRVFPAEDRLMEDQRGRELTASMRPRVFPAEDTHLDLLLSPRFLASMRPRVFPAEDGCRNQQPLHSLRRASMRPRVFPAEDVQERVLKLNKRAELQ